MQVIIIRLYALAIMASMIASSAIVLPYAQGSEKAAGADAMLVAPAYAQETAGNNDNTTATATTTTTKHYLYGCSQYEYVGFHCDPIQNEFESSTFVASYTKVASATRQPDYVPARFGEGVQVSLHSLESMRANVIDAYDSERFSVYISFKPDNSDEQYRQSYASLVSYRNGIYSNDVHDAGWQIETVPSDDESISKVRFTVFNSNGTGFSPPDATIPADRFSEILGSFDGRNVRLFVDGEMKGEAVFDGTYTGSVSRSNFLNIAGDAYCTCELASGVIDEVRYYNYSVTTAGEEGQKQQRQQQQSNNNGGLVGYWKFDGDLKDYSPYGNDLFYNTMISSAAFAPDGRLFYNEKNSGNIRVMTMAANGTALLMDEPFASIPEIHVSWDQGLLGLAIDSRFRENHFVYAYYNYKDEASGSIYGRVVRFTDSDNRGMDKTIILDRIPVDSIGFHTGGALGFNPVDEKLYVTVGDGVDPDKAQDLSSMFGKILRINRDGSIPGDNPFRGSPVYNYGHRNSFGIAFDDAGNGLYTEPGSGFYDEINFSSRGGNYGWPTYQPPDVPPELAADGGASIKPLRSYWHAITPTQAVYYDGDKHPELKGKFIFGSLVGSLYSVKLNEDGTRLVEEWRLKTNFYPSLEVVNVAVSPDGDIYFGAYDIYRLDGIDMSSRVKIMYPVQVNATGVELSGMAYHPSAEKVVLELNSRRGPGGISAKIPNSMISNILASGNQTAPDGAYSVTAESHGAYSLVHIQLSDNAPENLRFIIGRSVTMEAAPSIQSAQSATAEPDWRSSLLRPSGCLIATAAFGSELTPQVQYLRNFREHYILSTMSGSAFMNAFNTVYYSFSPQVADYEREHQWLQQTVKSGLYPLFGILNLSAAAHTLVGGGEAGSLAAGTVASMMIGAVYVSPLAALAWPRQKRLRSAAKVSAAIVAVSVVAIVAGILSNNPQILTVSTSLFVVSSASFSALLTVVMLQKAARCIRRQL